ncbi:tRNA dihydrouridine(20/20a) synthase DusA [Celerinatantimonas diazotrophica]|nr:tRNA dihydrouridine(20/20a) synthase DusA [Celerinatantimonas diazotrophica]
MQDSQLASNIDASLSCRFSVAPMLDWTDRHCRYFHRLLTSRTQLYTEMVTTGAILHGKGDYLLFNEMEQPVVLQLGGSSPEDLAKCAQIAQQRGYQEINLNVGCPSDRVQNGRFGACLMAEPQLVADCVKAMQDSAAIPVTVKTRIGIDHQDSYLFLTDFIETVATESQCQNFIVHARKAWLQGLSPKENREIPELDYERVYQLKRDYSHLNISINGGISNLTQALVHLEHVDGVMVGRAAYQNPYLLADVDRQIFADHGKLPVSREQVVEQMIPYIEAHLAQGGRLQHITRHMLGLYQGVPGARRWRRHLSENAHHTDAGVQVLVDAMKQLGLS